MKRCGFCETRGRDLLTSRHAAQAINAHQPCCSSGFLSSELSLALAVSYQLLNHFPGSIRGALPKLWPAKTESWTLGAMQILCWLPAALQLDCLHKVNASLQEHPWLLLLVVPNSPWGPYPKGKLIGSSIHPLALHPSSGGCARGVLGELAPASPNGWAGQQ